MCLYFSNDSSYLTVSSCKYCSVLHCVTVSYHLSCQ